MIKAHKIRLYPNKSQTEFFIKSCGVARFGYNWALNRWNELYKEGIKTSAYSLIKELTLIKKEQFPWMLEVGKTCPQYAIHNLEKAFKSFFKKNSKYPKFKKKGIKDCFVSSENSNQFKQKDKKIWIPRLGWVNCVEDLRFEGKVNNVVVKRIADKWFAIINIDTLIEPLEIQDDNENQIVIGVDLGIKDMAICSDGAIYENPKALKSKLKKLKREQRRLSRKIKGSNNKKKQQMKVANLHYRISCIRQHQIHKATTEIVKYADVIVLEDLNVKGMLKNHNLAQSISDVSFGEFRRQLEYKAKWYGKKIVIADRYYASSKTCSNCGNIKKDLKLNDRVYKCSNCGLEIDRDLNAAKNLANIALRQKLSEVTTVEKLVQ